MENLTLETTRHTRSIARDRVDHIRELKHSFNMHNTVGLNNITPFPGNKTPAEPIIDFVV